MPSADKTKIQKDSEGTNAKARDYYMKRRRAKVGLTVLDRVKLKLKDKPKKSALDKLLEP